MSAPRNAIIWLVLWLLWTILAYPMCLKDCCTEGAATDDAMGVVEDRSDSTAAALPAPARAPIDFEWSIARPNTNDGFDALKSSLLAQRNDNNVLEVTGLYFEGEQAPAGYENMGLARATLTKALIAPDLPDDRTDLRSRVVAEREGVREGYFEAVEFKWIQQEEQQAATVEELADRQIVRFPFNSVEKNANPQIDEYLDKLAARVKQSGERIRLVGHTDNVGPEEANMTLSDRRAKQIRDILIGKGVSRDQIIIEAKGETQPVAGNDTEAGMQENRRVEIFLVKN